MSLDGKALTIHPTAIVSDNNQIGYKAIIGAFSITAGDVVIGEDCTLAPHAIIRNGSILNNQLAYSHLGNSYEKKLKS